MAKVSLRSYNHEIDSLINRGQYEQAIAHCRHILRQFPKHIDTYRLLGKVFLENQRYGDAGDVFQRVLSSIPQDYISHVGMSIIREDEGNLDAAIWHMERASEVQPANKAIQAELRRLHGRRDRVEPPRSRLTKGALARMYFKGELYSQAISELRAALAEDPQRPDLQLLLANSYYNAGLRVEAADTCSALLSKLPFCFEANYMLAEILVKSDRKKESEIYSKRAIELDPYAAHVSPKALTPAQVPEAAVTIDRLEYTPSETQFDAQTQPEWASSLGVEVEGIDSGKESIPDWLSDIKPDTSQIESPQVKKSITVPPFTSTDQEDIPTVILPEGSESSDPDSVSIFDVAGGQDSEAGGDQESLSEDLIPEWMKAAGWIAANEKIGSESPSKPPPGEEDEFETPTEPGIPRADLPDWLQAMAPASDTSNELERQSEVTTGELGEAAALSWLDDSTSASPDNLATWLDEEKPASPTSTLPTTSDDETIPDWLEELDMELSGDHIPPPIPASSTRIGDRETSGQQSEEPILSSDSDPESIIQDLPATKLTETILSEESTVPSESVDTPSDVTEALTEGIGVTEAIDESLPESEPDKPEGIVESEQEDQPADESLSEELILSEATPLEDLFTDETILQGDEQESLAWLEELSDTGESSDIITDTPDDLKDTSLESVEGETTISGLDDSHAAQMKEIIMPEEEKFDQEPEPAPLESTSAEGEQEIPDWLQEIEASGDEEISEDLEPAEIPDWLRELAPTSGMEQEDAIPKMAEPIAETPSVPEILPEDIHEEIALEPELDEKSPEIHPGVVAAGAAVSKSSDSISEWLESLDEGKLQEPEPIMEVDLFDEVDTTLAAAALEEQESIYEKSEPVVTDAVPPFILDESEGDEPAHEIEEPATTADDTKPSIVTISKLQTEMEEPTPQVDGSPDEIIAETEVSIPEAEDVIPEALQVDESESDEIPTWLADLAEESEGDVDDQPAELTDEMPDWLRELAPESDDAGKETAGEIETPIVEPAQEITEEVTDDSGIPDWLQETTPDEGEMIVEELVQDEIAPIEEEKELPEVEPQMEATIDSEVGEQAAEYSPEDEDAAFAWLESLAVKQGADEALLLSPDERLETPPEWVQESSIEDQEVEAKPLVDETGETVSAEPKPVVISPEQKEITDVTTDDQVFAEETEQDLEPEAVAEDIVPDEISTPPAEPLEPIAEELYKTEVDEISGIEPAEIDEALTGFEEEAEPVVEPTEEMPELPSWLEGVEDEVPVETDVTWQPADAEPVEELPMAEHEVEPALPAEPLADAGEVTLLQARNALVQDDPAEALEKYNNLIQSKQMLPDVINDLREALYRFPVDVNLWQALGDAYARSGQLNEALDAYTKAEELLR